MIYMALRQETNLALAINIKQWTNRDAKASLLHGSRFSRSPFFAKNSPLDCFLNAQTLLRVRVPVITFIFFC